VSSVVKLSRPFADVPVRSRRVSPEVRLIDVFGKDVQLTGLCRYLDRVYDIWTIGELDAAGWNVVNGYDGKLAKKKRELFFHTIGKPAEPPPPAGGAHVLEFKKPALG
jgi:hypothetical protein